MIDVYEALWGPDRNAELRAGVAAGRCVAKVRCICGAAISTVHVHAGGLWSLSAGVRITRPGTADEIIEAALLDVETVCRLSKNRGTDPNLNSALSVLVSFLEQFPDTPDGAPQEVRQARNDEFHRTIGAAVSPLKFPPALAYLDELPEARGQNVRKSQESGTKPAKFASMSPTCPNCRAVWYVGDNLIDWFEIPAAQRPREIVATCRETEDLGIRTWVPPDEMPLDGLGRRLALYARLTGVLQSQSHRKVKSAT